MIRMRRTLSRGSVMTSVVAGGLLIWMAGTAAQQNFVGGNPTQPCGHCGCAFPPGADRIGTVTRTASC